MNLQKQLIAYSIIHYIFMVTIIKPYSLNVAIQYVMLDGFIFECRNSSITWILFWRPFILNFQGNLQKYYQDWLRFLAQPSRCSIWSMLLIEFSDRTVLFVRIGAFDHVFHSLHIFWRHSLYYRIGCNSRVWQALHG